MELVGDSHALSLKAAAWRRGPHSLRPHLALGCQGKSRSSPDDRQSPSPHVSGVEAGPRVSTLMGARCPDPCEWRWDLSLLCRRPAQNSATIRGPRAAHSLPAALGAELSALVRSPAALLQYPALLTQFPRLSLMLC